MGVKLSTSRIERVGTDTLNIAGATIRMVKEIMLELARFDIDPMKDGDWGIVRQSDPNWIVITWNGEAK